MKLVLHSIIGLLVLSQSQPVPSRPFGSLGGINRASCQLWSTNRNMNPRSSAVNLAPQLETWLTGFVDGVGYQDKNVAAVDPREVANLLDQHCADNPSQTLVQAAGTVLDRLPKR